MCENFPVNRFYSRKRKAILWGKVVLYIQIHVAIRCLVSVISLFSVGEVLTCEGKVSQMQANRADSLISKWQLRILYRCTKNKNTTLGIAY